MRLTDESVSETHAKLQRRDDGWYVVDMGSTNGTYVGGTRITGERRLDGAPDVRFGGVKLSFIPAGMREDGAERTRAIAADRPAAERQRGAAATTDAASRRRRRRRRGTSGVGLGRCSCSPSAAAVASSC